MARGCWKLVVAVGLHIQLLPSLAVETVEACRGVDGSCSPEEDASLAPVELLQVNLKIAGGDHGDASPPQAKSIHIPLDAVDKAPSHPARPAHAQNKTPEALLKAHVNNTYHAGLLKVFPDMGCSVPTPLSLQNQLTFLETVGVQTHHRRACHQQLPSVTYSLRNSDDTREQLEGGAAAATAASETTATKTSTRSGPAVPASIWLLIAYFVIAFAIALRMLMTVVRSTGCDPHPAKATFRPEFESYRSGLMSWMSISWVTPWVCKFGNTTDPAHQRIKHSDLGAPGFADFEAANAFEDFDKIWQQDLTKRGTKVINLYLVILRFCTWRKVIQLALMSFVFEILMYLGPTFCVDWTLKHMENMQIQMIDDPSVADLQNQVPLVFALVFMFTGTPMIMTAFNTLAFLIATRLNIRLESALTLAVYRKAQRMPVTGGEYDLRMDIEKDDKSMAYDQRSKNYSLVQLINTDINGSLMGFQGAVCKLIIEIPILVGLTVLMFIRMGKATFVAAGIIVGMSALLFYTVRQQVIRFRWYQLIVGGRLAFFQEIMHSIRMVKSNAYEPAGIQILGDLRKKELEQLGWMFFWAGVVVLVMQSYPRLVIIGGLSSYVGMHGDIRSSDIFVMMQILTAFKGCAHTCLTLLPALVAVGPSVARIDKMLKLEEAPLPGSKTDCPDATWLSVWPEKPMRKSTDVPPALRIQGTFNWANGKTAVSDLDITVRQGEMVAIMGEVGSGKTALLEAMLGELRPTRDSRLEIPARLAFHAQAPMICEATLKENIVYWSSNFDEKRYNEALRGACLLPDLEILPGGDMVPIGSRGISLSGGQKARVSLARAAYASDAEVVIVDDPFASVDVPTGQHLLDNLLLGPLMKDRARVVVCQPDRHRAKVFHKIFLMSDGKVVAAGPPEEVMKTPEYKALLSNLEATQLQEDLDVGLENSTGTNTGFERTANVQEVQQRQMMKAPELREEEHEGRADTATVHFYVSLGKYRNLIIAWIIFLIYVCLMLVSDLVLVAWSNNIINAVVFNRPAPVGFKYLHATTIWFLASLGGFTLHWYFGIRWTLNISGALYDMVLYRLMRAPVDKFFDKTPVGRIMNRMSFDMTDIDMQMYQKFQGCLGSLLSYAVPLVYVHVVMPKVLLLGSVPFYYLLWLLVSRYWNTMVPLRYANSVTRSDLNAYITEVEIGAITGRAYQVSHILAMKEGQATDNMIKVQFANACIARWTCTRVTLTYSIFCTCVAICGVLFLTKQGASVGTVGLCLSHISGIIMQAEMFLQQMTDTQFQFISMNRLHEYTDLPEERAAIQEGDGRYASPVISMDRRILGDLEIREEDKKVVVVRKTGNGIVEPFLIQPEGRQVFMAPKGKTLGQLDPDNQMLQQCTEWHYLHAVNEKCKNVREMAEELKAGELHTVWISIRSGWLYEGACVQMTDLVTGYADYPQDVLKGVTLTIEARSKTAIAGATGCGKSTMIQTFLRMLEPRSGKIEINGVDLQSMGLTTLRSNLGLVPQDPVLFTGTIRNNLDPFACYCDAEVWAALRAVQLSELVSKGGVGLDLLIKADGDNISFGQKQLICIARQILRNPELLLLDECTSAIDPHTQELVQETIRSGFPDATVVAIAHRLETIMDFDNVVVLDRGRVVEKGPIKELADAKNGWFAKMLHAKDRK